MKFLLIKPAKETIYIIHLEKAPSYMKIKALLKVDGPVCCSNSYVLGDNFSIWFDERRNEFGKEKEKHLMYFDKENDSYLMGNVFITSFDNKLEIIGLNDDDILNIVSILQNNNNFFVIEKE